jgi:Xaa-Pro aminopeptidase
MDESELKQHRRVQLIAKETMRYLADHICPGVTEKAIVYFAETFMKHIGIPDFWYHDIGALVQVGKNTTVSAPGADYAPSDEAVKDRDVVTVDLSPSLGNIWGDYARTFVIWDGRVVDDAARDADPELKELFLGVRAEKLFHTILTSKAEPGDTFGELYGGLNWAINLLGFENLDFRKNIGHTLERKLEDRKFIEEGSGVTLAEAGLFTLEPHIVHKKGLFGYKHEDVYYFSDGKLERL